MRVCVCACVVCVLWNSSSSPTRKKSASHKRVRYEQTCFEHPHTGKADSPSMTRWPLNSTEMIHIYLYHGKSHSSALWAIQKQVPSAVKSGEITPVQRTPRQIRREPWVQLSHLAAIVRCSWLHLITARKLPLSFREVGTFIIEHLSGNRLSSFIVSLYSSAGSSPRSRVRYDQGRHWTFVWLSTSIVPISSYTIKLISELWPAMSLLTLCQDLDMLVYGRL